MNLLLFSKVKLRENQNNSSSHGNMRQRKIWDSGWTLNIWICSGRSVQCYCMSQIPTRHCFIWQTKSQSGACSFILASEYQIGSLIFLCEQWTDSACWWKSAFFHASEAFGWAVSTGCQFPVNSEPCLCWIGDQLTADDGLHACGSQALCSSPAVR